MPREKQFDAAENYIISNALVASMVSSSAAGPDYGLFADASIIVSGETILWVGETADVPREFCAYPRYSAEGRLVTPALIDCHTHIVYAGDRSAEFEARLNGASYAEIALAGGGILSTVTATRAAREQALLQSALVRLDQLIGEGVGLVEVKSGYGLTIDDELKMLRVARALATHRDVHITTSFLAAHAVPAEFDGRADAYIHQVCIPALVEAQRLGLVDAVDGFCEKIAFSAEQLEPLFEKAKSLGLPIKLHAEQLSHSGGSALATRYGALSTDHVEYVTAADVMAMSASGTCAVLLPGAYYSLHETHTPPINLFREYRVPMALATDCNPGSSPMSSILLAMNMASTLFGMTPVEALAGVTCQAAKALGWGDHTGRIAAGMRADLALWDVSHPRELAYRIGFNPLAGRVFGGARAGLCFQHSH